MTYVINEPCIGVKDASGTEVCPVDCIHPTPDEPGFAEAEQLYIDPEECIDCDACVEACPVDAITSEDQGPGVPGRTACTLGPLTQLAHARHPSPSRNLTVRDAPSTARRSTTAALRPRSSSTPITGEREQQRDLARTPPAPRHLESDPRQ